jgi:DnaJ-class molecular chaperone
MRGRGVARAGRKQKGDQRVELRIVVPPDADDALRDFLTDWRKAHPFDPRADLLKGAGR